MGLKARTEGQINQQAIDAFERSKKLKEDLEKQEEQKKNAKVRIDVMIPRTLRERIDFSYHKLEMNRSELVSKAIDEFLEKHGY